MTTGPLSGIRILEICHMLAGPYCGMLLADLGAEVIKIEVGEGDISRRTGGHVLGDHNIYFASLNRNKKSIVLDLKKPSEEAEFHRLVGTSQALITNLRPQAIQKLGLTYDALKQWNERLVCIALTGFGLTGPYRDLPAYDYIIQAMAGVMMLTGEPGTPPVRAGYSVVDNTGGMMAAIGLLSKLVGGGGGQVDIALFDTLLSQLNYLAALYLNAGQVPERQPSGGHAYFVPAQIFPTKSGYIALFITHDAFWRKFAELLERPEWLQDPRFSTMEARNQNRELVIASIEAALLERTSEEWIELLRTSGIVIAAVTDLQEALASENTRVRNMVVTIPTSEGLLRLVGNPIKLDTADDRFDPPPLLGEDSDLLKRDGLSRA
jgi:crotonobetainyl-CoA:carnitine CoA-transferase CaiB-like acyl-CoA transferase